MSLSLGDDNLIGGTNPDAGNTIAYNTGIGVLITGCVGASPACPADGNAILSNSIHSNGSLGIDLNIGSSLSPDGVTMNDPEDGDSGANKLQNFPVLTSATIGRSIAIVGTLAAAEDTTVRLEFFLNNSCDSVANGEGETFLGFATRTTDASGSARFGVSFALPATPLRLVAPTAPSRDGSKPAVLTPRQFVTATATDSENNTSEFSECIEVR